MCKTRLDKVDEVRLPPALFAVLNKVRVSSSGDCSDRARTGECVQVRVVQGARDGHNMAAFASGTESEGLPSRPCRLVVCLVTLEGCDAGCCAYPLCW